MVVNVRAAVSYQTAPRRTTANPPRPQIPQPPRNPSFRNSVSAREGRKEEAAVMTFAPDYQSFEVLDFDKKRRITGKRVP